MSSISYLLLATLLCFIITFSDAQRCTLNDNQGAREDGNMCSTFENWNYKCDTAEETCKARESVRLSINTQTDGDQYCEEGFYKSTGQKCRKMATIGCNMVTRMHYSQENGLIDCPFHSTFDAGDNPDDPGTCTRENNQEFDFKGRGELCGYNQDGRRKICGHNLVCSSQNKCVRRSTTNEKCGTHNTECLAGLLCDNGRCVKPFSRPNGASCDNANSIDEHCSSGYCGPSRTCTKTPASEPCWRDIDCETAPHSKCVGASDSSQGTCLDVYNPARSDWLSCISTACVDDASDLQDHEELQQCMTTGSCQASYARYMCSEYCVKDIDKRNPLGTGHTKDMIVGRGEVPFRFDCVAQTVTKLDPQNTGDDEEEGDTQTNDCEITQQFTNCDAIVNYRSAGVIPSISLISLVLATLMILAIM